MTQLRTISKVSHCTYPGEYIPAPITMDELLHELKQPQEAASVPQVNVVEEAGYFGIEVAAPGLKSSDFLVSMYQNVLSVSVLHKEAACNRKYHLHEFNYWCFKRDIKLPVNIDTDFISARYKDGILNLRFPKSKEKAVSNVDRIIIY